MFKRLQEVSLAITHLTNVAEACIPGHSVGRLQTTSNVDSYLIEIDFFGYYVMNKQGNQEETNILVPAD